MPTSMPGLWNSIRALMFCLQTALPPPPAPEGIPLPLVFSTQPFLPLLSSPFLPLPSMAIRWCSGRFSRVFEPHFWSHHKSQNRNALGYPAHRHALGYPAHRNLSSLLYHVPGHTSFFLCTCPPTCSASSPCRPSPHPQSCHFPASSSDLLPTSCCAPGCYSSLARFFTCKICRPPLILTAQLPTLL